MKRRYVRMFDPGSFSAFQDKSSAYASWVKPSRSCTADVNRGAKTWLC